VRLAPLSPAIAVESTRLPGDFHRDPADRFIVATARELGATLVTRDERILRYGAEGFVQVLDATPRSRRTSTRQKRPAVRGGRR
jgi:predicted nucleic acid-binding protein